MDLSEGDIQADLQACRELMEKDNRRDALKLCQQLSKLAPGHADVHIQLAVMHYRWGDVAEGHRVVERMLADPKQDLPVWYRLRSAGAMNEGKLDEASAYLEQGLARFGAVPELIGVKIRLAVEQGDYQTAWEVQRSLGEPQPSDLGRIDQLLLIARQLGKYDYALELADKALGPGGVTDVGGRNIILSQKSLVLEKLGRYEESFESCRLANEMTLNPFDHIGHSDALSQSLEAWDLETFRQVPASAQGDRRLIFLVGVPRSGSSLLEQMLDTHPQVQGLGEVTWMMEAAERVDPYYGGRYGVVTNPAAIDQTLIDQVALGYLDRLPQQVGGDCLVDKQLFNFRLLPLIQRAFPRAAIVWCRRCPMDSILSMYQHYFMENNPFATLDRIVSLVIDAERCYRHWKGLGIPIVDYHYDALVQEPEQTLKALFMQMGLPWAEECLGFSRSRRVTRTASRHQVNKSLYTGSVGRWRHYAKQLQSVQARLEAAGIELGGV